ncbi:hypothetical protein BCD93_002010 [Clostridium saccharoperbutylacetonicum]|nr:hypothetical protein [Clostridium saccharoperbutylacetonicum]
MHRKKNPFDRFKSGMINNKGHIITNYLPYACDCYE